jgi:PKHD-type hydroxylase
LFISAALPNVVYPPMFNRYGEGMTFGAHIDGGVRINPHTGTKLRTDISATLFLSDPGDYDGGELEIEDTYGAHAVKLNAGDLLLYPATSLHQVTPITRGERLACFFWVESLIRDDGRRTLLYEMDTALQALARTGADEDARTTLIGCYHNLLRQWAET